MSLKTRSVLVLLALVSALLLTVSVMQAQSPIAEVVITYIDATSEPDGEVRVSAFVSVLDEEGRPVRPTEVDFTVFEIRTPVEEPLTVGRITAPLSVALLIDTGGNMARPGPDGVRAIDAAKDAAVSFIDALSEEDQVAVYEYDNQLRRRQGFTYDHNLAIDQSVVRLDAGEVESVCLYDALVQLLDEWDDQMRGPQAVVVITGNPTGSDNDSCRATLDEVLDRAELTTGNPIPILSVGFGRDIDEEALQQLARFTGGHSLVGDNSDDLTELVRKISNQLKGQFEISYPTQVDGGLARVEIVENNSKKSDTRQVFIPEADEPTPTPLPPFEIGLNGSQQPDEDLIQLAVEVPADVVLAKTELFVDDNLVQRVVSPPFETFEVDINELGPGTHRIRVEATDELGRIASSEIEATVNEPPTPTPTTAPTPEQAPAPVEVDTDSDSGTSGLTSTLSIILIGAGVFLLLALIGLIVYILFFYGRQSTIATEPPPPPPPVSPMITIDDLDATELDIQPVPATQPVGAPASKAKLVVLTGQHALSEAEYRLDQPEVKLGRNTSRGSLNDIAVQDREASRTHAKISFREQNYYIRDLNSSTGTRVNDRKITPLEDVLLTNGVEISIGPRVKFRFELKASKPPDVTLVDFEDDLRTIDDDRTVW